jgi:hypothetical protein
MKIGLYKPFKKLYFIDDSADNAAWSYELVNFSKIFAERGHEIHVLSDNDLDDRFKNIKNMYKKGEDKYDRIVIWCGSFDLEPAGDMVINVMRDHTDRLDFMLTDFALTPKHLVNWSYLFDNVYIQGTKLIFTDDDKLNGLSELILYKHEYKKTVEDSIAQKHIEFYFGGTERDRLDDFLEYVWRPGHIITTKSKFLGIENRIDRNAFKDTLDKTKYSIVITDVVNNREHFVSPRPYELYIHDIIAFFDSKYDPDGYFCPLDDWRRVHSYKEMREKMNTLNNDLSRYTYFINKQRQEATRKEFVSGDYVYEKLG